MKETRFLQETGFLSLTASRSKSSPAYAVFPTHLILCPASGSSKTKPSAVESRARAGTRETRDRASIPDAGEDHAPTCISHFAHGGRGDDADATGTPGAVAVRRRTADHVCPHRSHVANGA